MVTVQARFHVRIAVPPVVAIVAATGVGIAGPEVLTIGIRVELRAIAGVFDNLLRQRGSCKSCRGNSGGADQCKFHPGLLDRVTRRWKRAFSFANYLLVSSFKRDDPAPELSAPKMAHACLTFTETCGKTPRWSRR